ncbi:unnamed protein product [Chrysoparadoxa australica]
MLQRHEGGVNYRKNYVRVTKKHVKTKAGKLAKHTPDIVLYNFHKEEHCKVYVHAVELDRVTGNGVVGQITVGEQQWVRLELAKPHMIVIPPGRTMTITEVGTLERVGSNCQRACLAMHCKMGACATRRLHDRPIWRLSLQVKPEISTLRSQRRV